MCRGYGANHTDPETDSDGDGGVAPKLSGGGHIEFSQKGIPHGSLHFAEQLKWAGHMYMHDTSAPEASHKRYIKKPIDRVKKESDNKTAVSMIYWDQRVHLWDKIIDGVRQEPGQKAATTFKFKQGINNNACTMLSPTSDVVHLFKPSTFSPLRAGLDNLMSPDARISYHEVIWCDICTHIRAHIYVHSYTCPYTHNSYTCALISSITHTAGYFDLAKDGMAYRLRARRTARSHVLFRAARGPVL